MTDPPKKNRAQRRREAREARREEARQAKTRASRRLRTAPTGVQGENLNFEHLRMDSIRDSLTYGFVIQRAVATHGQPMPEPDPYSAYIKGCHDCLDRLQEQGINLHEIPAERREIIEELYGYLKVMEKHKWLAISAVYTYREELTRYSFAELVMILGPVKAEWFGRALKEMEGDPGLLACKDLKAPPCCGCRCHLDKPRRVTPLGVCDHPNSSVENAGGSCESCKASKEKEDEMEEMEEETDQDH